MAGFETSTYGRFSGVHRGLSDLIEAISTKPLGLEDVEPDIIGRSYEYLIRKFAEGSGQSAGEFYTPKEVGLIMAKVMDPEPGMEIYDPCCGSGGLLIKCTARHLAPHRHWPLRPRRGFDVVVGDEDGVEGVV